MLTPRMRLLLGAVLAGALLFPGTESFAATRSRKRPPPPVSEDRVYTVAEITQIYQSRPGDLKDKSVKVKGYVVDTAVGRGEEDFLVLTDRQFAGLYEKDLWHEPLSRRERRRLRSMPILRTGPTLDMPQSVFPTVFGIYRGHFFDKNAANFRNGDARFVIEDKVLELGIEEKSPQRDATVNKGLVIANGTGLKPPYRVTLKDRVVRVNDILYQPSIAQDILRITLKTDDDRLRQWASLVKFLKEGWLVIYGGNRYESIVWRFPSALFADIDAAVKAPDTAEVKKQKLAQLLDMPENSAAIDDILKNWAPPATPPEKDDEEDQEDDEAQ